MKRKEGQSFDDYRKERKQRNQNIVDYLKGRVIFSGGTFDDGKNVAKRELRKQGLK